MRTNCFVVVLAVITLCAVMMSAVNGALINSGKCGDKVNWELSDDGKMRIYGEGETKSNFGFFMDTPWYSNYSSIKSVVIEEGVTLIGTYAFESCPTLTSVTFPKSMRTIEVAAFDRCPSLTNVVIPEGLTTIKGVAFMSCPSLTSVTFPDTLTTIGDDAFSCSGLTSVTIPASVTYVGEEAFAANNLTWIEVKAGNKNYVAIDGVLFTSNMTILMQYSPKMANKSYTIPYGVQTIQRAAFNRARSLTNVIIPDSVKTVRAFAFSYSGITSVTIPASVTSISHAFQQTPKITSVFYQGTAAISDEAFTDCEALNTVCVAPGYTSSTFCGLPVNKTAEVCKQFQSMFNKCSMGACIDGKIVEQKKKSVADEEQKKSNGCVQYQCQKDTGSFLKTLVCEEKQCYTAKCVESNGKCEYTKNDGWEADNGCFETKCENNEWMVQKKKSAAEWEERSNECVQYKCDNETGNVAVSLCNSDNEICVNDKCVEKKTMKENGKVRIVVELDSDKVKINDINTAEILKVIDSGVETIGWEYDSKNQIRVILYAKDEETAQSVANTVKSLEKGEGCSYGILCQISSVYLDQDGKNSGEFVDGKVSGIESIHNMAMKSVLVLLGLTTFFARRM